MSYSQYLELPGMKKQTFVFSNFNTAQEISHLPCGKCQNQILGVKARF